MVQSFAATQGVDARQLNFLLNLAFIAVVAATVLTKVALVDLDFWRGWTPLEIFFRIPLDNWDGYMHVLTDHPVIVKGVTSCSVYTIGDWVAQVRCRCVGGRLVCRVCAATVALWLGINTFVTTRDPSIHTHTSSPSNTDVRGQDAGRD